MATDKEKLQKMDKYIDDNIIRLEETIANDEMPQQFIDDFEKEKAVYVHLKKVKDKWL